VKAAAREKAASSGAASGCGYRRGGNSADANVAASMLIEAASHVGGQQMHQYEACDRRGSANAVGGGVKAKAAISSKISSASVSLKQSAAT